MTLLHVAAKNGRSVDFCKLILDRNPELVKIPDDDGMLPIHIAISSNDDRRNSVKLTKLLFKLYPESINIQDYAGSTPIHLYFGSGYTESKVLRLMLEHGSDALSKPDNDGDLPLHLARWNWPKDIIMESFDIYPEAIYRKNEEGKTPFELALEISDNSRPRFRDDLISGFLQSQLGLAACRSSQTNNNTKRKRTTPYSSSIAK